MHGELNVRVPVCVFEPRMQVVLPTTTSITMAATTTMARMMVIMMVMAFKTALAVTTTLLQPTSTHTQIHTVRNPAPLRSTALMAGMRVRLLLRVLVANLTTRNGALTYALIRAA